jgi:hypothetical protein
MLDDPRVNFAISTHGTDPQGTDHGVDHLGIQVDSREELGEIAGRLESAGRGVNGKGEAHCCDVHSGKAWVRDPEGLPWETFFTFGSDTLYGEDTVPQEPVAERKACCAPTSSAASKLAKALGRSVPSVPIPKFVEPDSWWLRDTSY